MVAGGKDLRENLAVYGQTAFELDGRQVADGDDIRWEFPVCVLDDQRAQVVVTL
jgi:hypothetical protein